MPRTSLLLALVPLLGLVELGLHQYFAQRAPDFRDYQALAPELLALKQPGVPVVVAPAWAEPLVRQAAPAAFPLSELARADDSRFAGFLEVSMLGQAAPELAAFPAQHAREIGPFRLVQRQNPRPEPPVFDFVAAVDSGDVEVFVTGLAGETERSPCRRVERPRAATGGLHGHLAYPSVRYECGGGRSVGVTVLDDEQYRPRRCVLAQPPDDGRVVLRFGVVPASRRLLGFAGFSYFLERDVTADEMELSVVAAERNLGQYRASGTRGWARFELGPSAAGPIEVSLRRLRPKASDFCFALEAR